MTIIAAPRGFRLVRAFRGETGFGDDPRAVSEIVLAFRIEDRLPYPLPITSTGAPDLEKPWLLVHPDGRYSMGTDQYSDFGEWQADMGLGGLKSRPHAHAAPPEKSRRAFGEGPQTVQRRTPTVENSTAFGRLRGGR